MSMARPTDFFISTRIPFVDTAYEKGLPHMKLLVLALLILYDSMLIFQLEHVKALDTMAPYVWESGDFRAMRLGRDAADGPSWIMRSLPWLCSRKILI